MSTLAGPVPRHPFKVARRPRRERTGAERRHRGFAPDPALAAAVAAATVATLTSPARPVSSALSTLLVYAGIGLLAGRASRWGAMLPLTGAALVAAQPILGAAALGAAGALTELSVPTSPGILATGLAAAVAGAIARSVAGRRRHGLDKRVIVIGAQSAVQDLRHDLDGRGIRGYQMVGSIAVGDDSPDPGHTRERLARLASLDALDAVVEEHAIDLVLIASSASRTEIFRHVVDCCLRLPVRVCELSQFYEDALGHVPEAEIDAAWFRYIMHPRFDSSDTAAKRAVDLAVGSTAALFALPLLLACAALIKLHDGGPVFFSQLRIGSGGRPFTLFKLRTMRIGPPSAVWSSARDRRVTPIGRLLRRTHIDEMPQLLNVIRGEMSLVGPRPEQPELVEHLEDSLPFYSRRNLITPGLTGWAQVRCGYAGSDAGSAWKLCHDLFYLKHRSFGLDMAILLETVRTLVADRQFPAAPTTAAGCAAAHPGGLSHRLQGLEDDESVDLGPALDLAQRRA